jgi:hypothetical protein
MKHPDSSKFGGSTNSLRLFQIWSCSWIFWRASKNQIACRMLCRKSTGIWIFTLVKRCSSNIYSSKTHDLNILNRLLGAALIIEDSETIIVHQETFEKSDDTDEDTDEENENVRLWFETKIDCWGLNRMNFLFISCGSLLIKIPLRAYNS